MNHPIRLKTTAPPLLIILALLCFALSPTAQALLPPPAPDGGYPGGNTAEGFNALFNVNTALGINNTAVGANALTADTTGQYNVAVGSGALQNNTTGFQNMAVGAEALANNIAGTFNMAIGFRALFMNTGSQNSAVGAAALRNNTTGQQNTAIGSTAMRENTTGFKNTATGGSALFSNTIGHDNTANGFQALLNNTTGSNNTANGALALLNNTEGENNTATGFVALAVTTGSLNTANGAFALSVNTTGTQNTATGADALGFNDTGSLNTATGVDALLRNTTGISNIALGVGAGSNLTTGDNNIDIGNNGTTAEANTIRIGVQGTQTATFIAGISGATVTGTAVVVDGSGQLGVAPSSARFKEAIKSMDNASEALFSLKPVTFRYKKEIDPKSTAQFGLVAEDVEKVNADLVVRDAEGKVYTVRYDAVNAMLLNEFLKEHRTVQELKKEIAALTAAVQKVSAQVEMSRAAPQTVVDNH